MKLPESAKHASRTTKFDRSGIFKRSETAMSNVRQREAFYWLHTNAPVLSCMWISVCASPWIFFGVNLHQLWSNHTSHDLDLFSAAVRVGNAQDPTDSGIGWVLCNFSCGFLSLRPINVAVLRLLFRPNWGAGKPLRNGEVARRKTLKRKLRAKG
jgi:hypothetical protein